MYNIFFFFENLAVCEIRRENMVQPERPHTHSEYVNTYRFSRANMVRRRRLSVTFIYTLPILFLLQIIQTGFGAGLSDDAGRWPPAGNIVGALYHKL